MRKSFLIAIFGSLLAAGAAQAADMPRAMPTKAPMYDPAVSWSGFYVGANAGAAFATANIDDKDCFNCDSDHTSGFAGSVGGQMGINWQSRSFVYGVEVDGNWMSYDKSFILCSNCGPGPDGQRLANNYTKIDALLSARGRVGLAVDNTLVYATGGVAFGHMDNRFEHRDFEGNVDNAFAQKDWHIGIVGGVGVETKWDNNWSFRAEWLHYQLETKLVGDSLGGNEEQFGFGAQIDVVRVGLNYTFGGGSVSARY